MLGQRTLWTREAGNDVDIAFHAAVQEYLFDAMGGGKLVPVVSQGRAVADVVDGEGKQLVDACVAGDTAARERFHAELLPLIYRFERGGRDHEAASQNFFAFLFDNDRLYRRLRSYRGAAPLRAYLWDCILPDLMKQFRALIRRQHLETVSIDDGPVRVAAQGPDTATDCGAPDGGGSLLDRLPVEKRLLLKLLYIEDFDLDAAELQLLAERTGRTVRDVIERLNAARETVRSREAMQHARLEGAESAGQWIRLYERKLAQIEADLAAADAGSSRAVRLQTERTDLLRKLDKRRRQQAARLRTGSNTVVTLPTAMVADFLGQPEPTTRAQITRVRQELAAVVARDTVRRGSDS